MTAQEIFDRVSTHLFAQGHRSVDHSGQGIICLYRGPGGAQCAMGCLIPDDVYEVAMECQLAQEVIRYYSGLSHLAPYETLVRELQLVHDGDHEMGDEFFDSTATAKLMLTAVAEDFGLSSDILDTLDTLRFADGR